MTDVNEIVAGKPVDELDALIAAATAEKENAKVAALTELTELAEAFKVKCEAVGVKAKTYFSDKKESVPSQVYANPADGSQTYSKGPRPQWLKDALEGITDRKAIKAKMAEFLVA